MRIKIEGYGIQNFAGIVPFSASISMRTARSLISGV